MSCSMPSMRCGREVHAPLVSIPSPIGAMPGSAQWVVPQVEARRQAQLKAAPVVLDIVDEGLGEVGRGRVVDTARRRWPCS